MADRYFTYKNSGDRMPIYLRPCAKAAETIELPADGAARLRRAGPGASGRQVC